MRKIMPVLLFSLFCAVFAEESVPPHIRETISAIEDADSECSLDFLDEAEAELRAFFPEESRIIALIAKRKAIIHRDSARYGEALSEGNRAERIYGSLISQNPSANLELELADLYSEVIAGMHAVFGDDDNLEKTLRRELFLVSKNKGEECEEAADCCFSLGTLQYKKLNYPDAEKFLKKSIRIWDSLSKSESSEIALAYFSLGAVYDAAGKTGLARKNQEKAASILERYAQSNGDADDIGIVYGTLETHFYSAGEFKKAETYGRRAVEFMERTCTSNDVNLASAYENLSAICYALQDYDSALAYINKALGIYGTHFGESTDYFARAYQNLSEIYAAKNDEKRAFAYQQKSLKIKEAVYGKDSGECIDGYSLLEQFHTKNGNFNEALSLRTKIHRISKKYDSFYIADGHAYLGDAHFFGEFEPGGKLFGQLKNEEIKQFFNGLYESYSRAEIVDDFKSLCPRYCGAKSPRDLAVAMQIMALKRFRKANDDEKSFYDCIFWENLGMIFLKQYDFDAALDCFGEMLSLSRETESDYYCAVPYAYAHIANVKFLQKKYGEAAENWKHAYKNGFADDRNPLFSFTSINSVITCLLKKETVDDSAFIGETLARAMAIIERYRTDISHLKADIMKEMLPFYYFGINFFAAQNDCRKAFEYSESMRNRGFLDQIGTETALKLDGIADEERVEIKKLLGTIESCRKKLGGTDGAKIFLIPSKKKIRRKSIKNARSGNSEKATETPGAEESFEAAEELSDAERRLSEIEGRISKRIPKYASLRNPKTATLKDAQKFCGKDRAILEFAIWKDEYYGKLKAGGKISSCCIVITGKKTEIVMLDGEFDYARAVGNLYDGVRQRRDEADFEAERNELYEKLIAPVSDIIAGKKQLLIVPDAELSILPFDILRKNADSMMLGDEFAISLSPSVSVSMISARKSRAVESVFALGGAWYDTGLTAEEHNDILTGEKAYETRSGWSDLPGTLAELHSLQGDVFKKIPFTSMTQENATEANVKSLSKSGALEQYSVVHFACHGYFSAEDKSQPTSILFSEISGNMGESSHEDGYLTISEASVLNLGADMVCLSACETGLVEGKAGDGMVGLARSFMVAGASRVGVSLWEASDEATAQFMAEMYRKVVSGKSYADAYRATKSEFRQSAEFGHPFYWALFTLYE